MSPVPSPGPIERLLSLDVFRGLTVAAMLLVNNPGLGQPYGPLKHAIWHGCTFTDLIFPAFLFIMGVVLPFTLHNRRARTEARGEWFGHRLLGDIWLRAATLVVLGLLLVGLPIPGQRQPPGFAWLKILRIIAIGLAYGTTAAMLVLPARATSPRAQRLLRWMPAFGAAVFVLLVGGMYLANRIALARGLPQDFFLGSGVFWPQRMRIPGVLQRIGICYGLAGTILLYWGWRGALGGLLGMLVVYSVLMLAVPLPGHVTGSLSMDDNFARRIDDLVFNRYVTLPDGSRQIIYWHTYEYPDNEGIVSTLPAVATTLLGALLGLWLIAQRRDSDGRTQLSRPPGRRVGSWLLVGGWVLVLLGLLLHRILMPINKVIWTPSYVAFSGGVAMMGFGVCYLLVEVAGWRWTTRPLVVFGTGSIVAFVGEEAARRASYLFRLPHTRSSAVAPGAGENLPALEWVKYQIADAMHWANGWLHHLSPRLPPIDTPGMTSLAYSISFVVVFWCLLTVLQRLKLIGRI
ncbi:acyltransferase family protein [Fontivita pretiosa]|uniref:acyltransferase family protein n=1 Tax=Fontivita pretiosa TaxID=2989684 RepID=UPI003D174E82